MLLAIAAGCILSYFINPAVAVASALAFAVGELADLAVFTPLDERGHLWAAVVASGVIGGVIDTLIFLRIAFGSFDYWQGQIIAKTMCAVVAGFLIAGFRALPHRLATK